MKNISKLSAMLLTTVSSMLAAGSALAVIPGVPECTAALDFVDGCQVNVQGPTTTATLTARLVQADIDSTSGLPFIDPVTGDSNTNPATGLPFVDPITGDAYNKPTTEAEALAALEFLAIAVDGLTGGSEVMNVSQQIANAIDASVMAIDYSPNMSEIGTVQDLAAGFQSTLVTINGLRDPSDPKTVVMGYSLGGMISRYALSTMEDTIDHNVGLYVSYETPHKGAYIPQALQNIPVMLEYSNGVLGNVVDAMNSGPVKVRLNLMGVEIDQQKVDANQALIDDMMGMSLSSPLAKQILIDNVKATTEFDTFMAEYDGLGLPQNTDRNIAITNGSLVGLGQVPWSLLGGKFYHFHGRVGSSALVNNGDAYADANFQLYPTVAGQRNIWAGIVGARLDVIGWFTNTVALGTGKDFNTPADAKEYDTVPGGWLDMSGKLGDANDAFSTLSDTVLTRHEPAAAFSFVPVYSSLDIDQMHDYSLAVDANNSTFDAADIFSMSSFFQSVYGVDNGPHPMFVMTAQIANIIAAKVRQPKPPTLDEKVVLWISDVDTATSCIDCNDDRTFRDVVSCSLDNFVGCLVSDPRRGDEAEYFGSDLYYHAADTGFATIVNMKDARYVPDPTLTTDAIIAKFRTHVETLPQTYWDSFTKSNCEDQDTYTAHQNICDKLP